jgi:hypothetical protein
MLLEVLNEKTKTNFTLIFYRYKIIPRSMQNFSHIKNQNAGQPNTIKKTIKDSPNRHLQFYGKY